MGKPYVKVRGAGKAGVTKVAGFCADFKAFVLRGNVIDLAIGVIIGAAFSAIVASLVADIIGPIIGLVSPGGNLEELFVILRYGNDVDRQNKTWYPSVQKAKDAGAVTLNYGKFIQTVINFLIIAFCLFLIIKLVGLVYKKHVAVSTDWPCPKCKESVKEGAIRCPHCTSEPIAPEIKETKKNDEGGIQVTEL